MTEPLSRVVGDVYCPKCLRHFPVDIIRLFCPYCDQQHLIVVQKTIYKGDLNG